jgi:multidrug efflux pump subunit AcrA (membrane-fusion protein)
MHPNSQQMPTPEAGTDGAMAVVLRAQAALLSHASLADAATALALELARALQCTRVSVGLLDGLNLNVVATSQGHDLDARLGAATAIAAAMHEALDQSRTINYPNTAPGMAPILVSHQLLADQSSAPGGDEVAVVCTVPVKRTGAAAGGAIGSVVGALCLERTGAGFTAQEIAVCEDAASFAGPVLWLLQQAALPWWRRSWQAAGHYVSARGHAGYKAAAAVAALVALAVLTVPVGYRVSAPARLEGSVQRAIVAPADGFLQQANVRAGDTVKEGQVLAELASDDLQLERRRRESELAQHENAYRAAQARNDRAQMVISQSRAGEAQAMLSLAESQMSRARIQAPFDGVVIKGDLSQTLGAPVQRGEVLLTLAPNNSFRLLVEVDESDISAIEPGQHGQLALAAVPERALRFTTTRVVPVAASADARNFFEVEATLDAAPQSEGQALSLRPGLSGVARIQAGDRTVWWQLTHRLLNWLRLSVWSIGL